MSKRVHLFRNATYYYPVLVFVGSWAQCTAYLKKQYKVDLGIQTAGGGFHQSFENKKHVGENFSLVWLPRFDKHDWTDIRVLSHELLHCAMEIMEVVNVPYSYNQQEALCYLHEDLNRQAHGALDKRIPGT